MKVKMDFKWTLRFLAVMLFGLLLLQRAGLTAHAKEEPVVQKGISVEGMDMSGMTKSQARAAIEGYVYELLEQKDLIHLQYEDVAEQAPTAAVLGGQWINTNLPEELVLPGNAGHVVDRYKARKDLEANPVDYKVELAFDEALISAYIDKAFKEYDQPVKNLSLVRKEEAFEIVEGETGYEVDLEASAKEVAQYLSTEWDRGQIFLPLTIAVVEPKGTAEELEQVGDLLGSFTTSFKGGSAAKVTNISNGARLINGITMYPGEEFSFDAYAAPYTISNGYAVGQAYESGRLVDSVGGGICQVSSTLYNTILRAELEVTMRYNHSMIVGYVPISSDATLAESSGKDLRFCNNLEAPIYIEAYVTKEHTLVVNIYGKETRPENRTVEYVSETLEVINPGPDVINVNGTMPVGQIQVSSAYTGYKAKLWKVVKVDGVEESRELVNTSNYRAVARVATVGMYTTDPAVLQQMNDAVATGNIDHIQNVINSIMAPPPAEEQ